MSSGGQDEAKVGFDLAEMAGGVDGAGAQRQDGAAAAAMAEADVAATAQALSGAGAGALAAMEAAAAIGHGGLPAGTARAGACAAARRRQIVAGRVAVPEPATRLAGGGMEPDAGGRNGWDLRNRHGRERHGSGIDALGGEPAAGPADRVQTLAEPGGKARHAPGRHDLGQGGWGADAALQHIRMIQQHVGDRAGPHQQDVAVVELGGESGGAGLRA
jgi:hypothetical protein